MACIYCRRAPAVVARRCQACADYLDGLHSSDDQADRDYAARLVNLAHQRATGTHRHLWIVSSWPRLVA